MAGVCSACCVGILCLSCLMVGWFWVGFVVRWPACVSFVVLGCCCAGRLVVGLFGVAFIVLRPASARPIVLGCYCLSSLLVGLFGVQFVVLWPACPRLVFLGCYSFSPLVVRFFRFGVAGGCGCVGCFGLGRTGGPHERVPCTNPLSLLRRASTRKATRASKGKRARGPDTSTPRPKTKAGQALAEHTQPPR